MNDRTEIIPLVHDRRSGDRNTLFRANERDIDIRHGEKSGNSRLCEPFFFLSIYYLITDKLPYLIPLDKQSIALCTKKGGSSMQCDSRDFCSPRRSSIANVFICAFVLLFVALALALRQNEKIRAESNAYFRIINYRRVYRAARWNPRAGTMTANANVQVKKKVSCLHCTFRVHYSRNQRNWKTIKPNEATTERPRRGGARCTHRNEHICTGRRRGEPRHWLIYANVQRMQLSMGTAFAGPPSPPLPPLTLNSTRLLRNEKSGSQSPSHAGP